MLQYQAQTKSALRAHGVRVLDDKSSSLPALFTKLLSAKAIGEANGLNTGHSTLEIESFWYKTHISSAVFVAAPHRAKTSVYQH